MMEKSLKRKYLTIDDVQKEYLPISKKKIRILVKRYLPTKMIGNRIFVEREKLEELLSNEDVQYLNLNQDEQPNLEEK